MKTLFKNLKEWTLFAFIFFSVSCFANQIPSQSSTILSFFDGKITAKAIWMSQPSTRSVAQLKIELLDSANQPYDIDPSLVSVGLFSPSMPDMGVEPQNVVSLNDPSGNPIPGVFIASEVIFSMQGEWEVQMTLPNPKNQNQTEMKKFNQAIK